MPPGRPVVSSKMMVCWRFVRCGQRSASGRLPIAAVERPAVRASFKIVSSFRKSPSKCSVDRPAPSFSIGAIGDQGAGHRKPT